MTDEKLLIPNHRHHKSSNVFTIASSFVLLFMSLILVVLWYNVCPWNNFIGNSCPIQKFDYTLLTIRWPPGICKSTHCIDDYPKRWLIHGLWPNYANGSWPQFCCPSTPFNVDEVEPIRSQLENNWSNLENGKEADSLWEHEWDKHGTCSTLDVKLRGELKYFNYTLTLFNQIPVWNWLKGASIEPDSQTMYEYSTFYEAIHSKFQKRFALQCQRIGSKTYLQQIEFCFDKITFEHRDCEMQNIASCKNGFLYMN